MRYGASSSAFQAFRSSYGPYLPKQVPDKETLIDRTGFEKSQWGARTVVEPSDPNRPGIIAAAEQENFEAGEQSHHAASKRHDFRPDEQELSASQ